MVYMIVVLFTILCKKRPRLAFNLSEQKKTPHSHCKLIATTSIHKNNQYILGWYFEKKRGHQQMTGFSKFYIPTGFLV